MGRGWEITKIIIEALTLGTLIAGTVIGYRAVQEYHNANTVSSQKALLEIDADAFRELSEKPYLNALFVQPSEEKDPNVFSRKVTNLFLLEGRSNKLKSLEWKDVPDLYGQLWEINDFNNPVKMRLREADFFAEQYLYLMLDAHIALKLNMLRQEDYDLWASYLDQIGANPLFLVAVYEGHKYGYITKDFAKALQSRLKQKESTVRVLSAIYSDMISENWAENVGKGTLK